MTDDAAPPTDASRRPGRADGRVRYLSLDWINAVAAEIRASEHITEVARAHSIGATQVVTGGPEGDVTYHVEARDGEISIAAGAADPEDVRMEQSWDTAVAVATGEMNAQAAFVGGHILLTGDQRKLLDAQPVFGALDAAFSAVKERTHYE